MEVWGSAGALRVKGFSPGWDALRRSLAGGSVRRVAAWRVELLMGDAMVFLEVSECVDHMRSTYRLESLAAGTALGSL
jgi:hypothetical protein